MVMLEAMSAGCAVITTDHPACAELVGDAGITVPAGDSRALRDAVATLLANPERVAVLARLGRKRAAAFASARVAERFTALFERARRVGSGSGRPATTTGAADG